MIERDVYYNKGNSKRIVSVCSDCSKIILKRCSLIAITVVEDAYDSICKVIKEQTQGNKAVNFYEAVKVVYDKSERLREYLRNCGKDLINKDNRSLWKFR